MDSYAITRRIEQAGENDVKNVCIRFYAINNGKDIWVSGEAFNNAGGMFEFLTEVVNLPRLDARFVTDSPFEVIATEGEGLDLAFIGKVFNWELFGLITCALEEYNVEVLRAAKSCGVDYDRIGDKYEGKYENFLAFVTERWDELYLEDVPEFCKLYIDYGKVATDWELEGRYSIENGYVFGC